MNGGNQLAKIMRRTISSAQTFFMKWVFPVLWIGGFGIGTCALWIDALRGGNGNPPPDWMKWQFLMIWLVVSSFILWFCGRLKRLQVDDEALYVSNYRSEERVPLAEVSHFTRSRFTNPPTVTIHLQSMSPYGERIVFIPTHRWFPFGPHPVIRDLQELCDRAKGQAGPMPNRSGNSRDQWPFADPKNVAVITLKSITTGGSSILQVAHDAEDGMWQFLDGTTVSEENASVVSLEEITRIDSTIMELADLPLGWYAYRSTAKEPWRRRKR